MRKGMMILLVIAMMTLFSACDTPEPFRDGLRQVHFEYDSYSGNLFYLDAWVEHVTETGAEVKLKKRIGPNNSTGIEKEGTLKINAEQLSELQEILNRYDLKAFSQLPTKRSGSSPRRMLRVWKGEEDLEVAWNAAFPKTTPPEEDLLYYELFQFFNGCLKQQADWQEVVGDDLRDPRTDPRCSIRTVEHFGNTVALVPGTGNSTDGHGAELDYGKDDWWVMEGFIGTWKTAVTDRFETTDETGTLSVANDGSVVLKLNEMVYRGSLGKVRTYLEPVRISLEADGIRRVFEVQPLNQDDYSELHIASYPGPVPEVQYEPIDLYAVKEQVQ